MGGLGTSGVKPEPVGEVGYEDTIGSQLGMGLVGGTAMNGGGELMEERGIGGLVTSGDGSGGKVGCKDISCC